MIYLATACFYHMERKDGILVSDFSLLLLQEVRAQTWFHSCALLTNSSSDAISLTIFSKAAVFFDNMSSIGSVTLRLSVLNTCATIKFSYSPPATRLLAGILRTLRALKMTRMLLARVNCTFYSQLTLVEVTTYIWVCTTPSSFWTRSAIPIFY